MLQIELWIIIIIIAVCILAAYIIFYKKTQKNKLHGMTEEHKVSEPHSDLNILQNFIEKCWGQGYSIPEIKEILLEKGWNEETIKKVFYNSKVPNEAEKTSRLKRTFSNAEPQVTRPVTLNKPQVKKQNKFPNTARLEVKPQIKKQNLQTPKPIQSKKVKKQNKTQTNTLSEGKFDIGNSSEEDVYIESKEVTKLKKEVRKDT